MRGVVDSPSLLGVWKVSYRKSVASSPSLIGVAYPPHEYIPRVP